MNLLERIKNLSAEQRERLLQKINKRKQQTSPVQPGERADTPTERAGMPHSATQISRQARESNRPTFPLSFTQERLWFLDQVDPGKATYNIPLFVHLTGSLNVTLLEKSFAEIVRRHEALRTHFALKEGQPVQVITPAEQMKVPALPIIDLQVSGTSKSLAPSQLEAEARKLAVHDVRRPFDLTQGPLWRAQLVRLGTQKHIFIFTTHHMIFDASSTQIFIREWQTLYKTFLTNKPSPLPDLPIQYADFAVWQREWLQGDDFKRQLSYWKEHLKGDLPALQLPTDYPRPAVQTFQGGRQPITLSPRLTKALRTLSQQEGVTLFMTLMAAFKTLLYRYTGQTDIVIGSPNANRNRVETEGVMGFFANNLVLRTDLTGNPTFRELLIRVRNVALGANAHQDMPFQKLVETLQPERHLSYNPLFQVMFTFGHISTGKFIPIAKNGRTSIPSGASNRTSRDASPREYPTSDRSTDAQRAVTFTQQEIDNGFAVFDLTLDMMDDGQQLIGAVEYNGDLFETATIDRLIGNFQTLLESIVANPAQAISTLPILTEAQQHQLLVEWNDTTGEYAKDLCFHQLVEAQVARTPDAVALVYSSPPSIPPNTGREAISPPLTPPNARGETQNSPSPTVGRGGWGVRAGSLTYDEFNRRANQLAHYLQKRGVGPEMLVAICMERSLEMIIALFAILKAGAAFLPLDPTYPKERLAFMLQDSEAVLLLTQQRLESSLPTFSDDSSSPRKGNPSHLPLGERARRIEPGPEVICVDSEWPKIMQESDQNPICNITPDHLAYMIYTSGSTGRPKGVLIAHRGVCSMVEAEARQFDIGPGSRVLQFASLSFDACVFEIAMTLPVGATLCLGSKESMMSGEILRDQQITVATLPPSLWAALSSNDYPSLQTVFSVGEACPPNVVQEWAPGRRFFNPYGPTETTCYVTIAECFPDGKKPTIGRPILNAQIYILDQQLQPVPIGVPGELHIGAIGIARGYKGRAALTAQKFIPNPFSDEPGARLYKTGDLVRYLLSFDADLGNPSAGSGHRIDFLGRIDHQVKVRGFRVELGEIEAILGQHPAVQETVVLVREETAGDKRIVAYVIPVAVPPTQDVGAMPGAYPQGEIKNSLLDSYQLRRYLSQKLPDYMVPSAFVFLDDLPRTPNGKVNRRALPAPPNTVELQPAVAHVMPQTDAERQIAQVWQEQLKVEKVGIHDNFFDLGGNSLLMIQIHKGLQERFGQKFSIVEMFKLPTIHLLAKYITEQTQEPPAPISVSNKEQTKSRRERKAAKQERTQRRREHREKK